MFFVFILFFCFFFLCVSRSWDGKPIPYWLYKLHGLNIEYACEICGDYAYRGPRAYQRHFQEARHAQGLRSLGIPNVKAFVNIVKIADAKTLWEKMAQTEQAGRDEEEVEDRQGNVMSRRAFEELRRQGLV